MTTINPILAELTRGTTVESLHRGAVAVAKADGTLVLSLGDVRHPVFPRSAVKAFQCLPLLDSGAADRFGFTLEEIALCCASHNGEADHVRVASSMLAKAGIAVDAYECGAHWPARMEDRAQLVQAGAAPSALHNNCSGKHAGMLALAKHIGAPLSGYTGKTHPVQQAVAAALDRYCDANTAAAPWGVDGCSVPTWAMPLANLAQGFARLFGNDNAHGQRMAAAARAHPFMVAGSGNFDTRIMQAVPRLFVKVGAEGVYCGAVPHAGLGFALKVDDGATRAAEVAIARVLAGLDCWTDKERSSLTAFTRHSLQNWRKLEVGEARARF
jgi:L-asparaginase II